MANRNLINRKYTMPSKDYVYDLLDRLEEDKNEYIVLVLNDSKKEIRGDVYFNITNENSFQAGQVMLENLFIKFDEHGLDGLVELDGQDIDVTPPEDE